MCNTLKALPVLVYKRLRLRPRPKRGHPVQCTLITCVAAAAAEDFEDPDTGATLNTTAVCLYWQSVATAVAGNRTTTIQSTLNNRLTAAATIGDTALATAVTVIQTAAPEVAVVILADTGADPLKFPYLVNTQHTLLALSILLHSV